MDEPRKRGRPRKNPPPEVETEIGRPLSSALSTGARGKTNWIEVETLYVTGIRTEGGQLRFPSLEDLSKMYGLKRDTIAKHSHRKQWVKKREEYLEKLNKKVIEKKSEDFASEILQFDRDMFQIAKALKHIVTEKAFVITRDDNGRVVKAVPNTKMNTLDVRRSAEVCIMIQTVREKAVGEGVKVKEKTAVDDLVSKLDEMRKEAGIVTNNHGDNGEDVGLEDDVHAGDFPIWEDV